MSLERQPYEELCSNIRARPIGWDGYQRTGTIAEIEHDKIKAIDKVPLEKRIVLVEKEGETYAKLFLGDPDGDSKGILGRVHEHGNRAGGDIVQYILVLMGDLLDKVPTFPNSILSLPHPYTNLLPLLSHPDVTVPVFTSKLLTTLISTSLNSQIKPNESAAKDTITALPTYLQYLATLTKSQDTYLQDLGVQSYVTLLRNSYARQTFWRMGSESFAPLVSILEAAAGGPSSGNTSTSANAVVQGGVGLQLLYHVLLVVWELSFEVVVAKEIHEKYDLIPTLAQILRSAIKEKIARITTAIFYNLSTKSPSANLPQMLISKLLPLLRLTLPRFTSDEELTGDLTNLIETLDNYQKSQTTFDEYAIEVRSGHLSWSPTHKNTDFWKKNARRIVEENNGELMVALARALGSSGDNKLVLAVAAHDVGVLVREVPDKRKKWEQLGVKSKVMQLMGDSDASVRYEALTAVRGFLEHAFS